MRKLTSGMAALALCVALSVPSFAATGYASDTIDRDDYRPSTTTSSSSDRTQTSTSTTEKAESQLTTSKVSSSISSAVRSGNSTATVEVRNAKTIDADTLKEVAAQAEQSGVAATIHADQVEGNRVIARLYIDPAQAANLTGTIDLSASVDEESTKVATDVFNKFFENEIAAIHLGQNGSYGMNIGVAVKVDLSNLDVENLQFFVYNRETNTYVTLTAPNYYSDANGYLHFDTPVGGDVIISDQPLTAK